MTLREKTLLTTGAILVAMIALLFLISNYILGSSVAQAEQQSINQSVARAVGILDHEISELASIASDWAPWDDTYAFIEDGNEAYIRSNLVDSTFGNLRLNLMLFVHSSGRVVFAKAFDLKGEKEIPVSASLKEHLIPDTPLLQHPDLLTKTSGIILLPEGPLLVASHPIQTSKEEGPIRGTLIIGRFLNEAEAALLPQLTQSAVQLYRFDDPGLPRGVQNLGASGEKTPFLIQQSSDQLATGYTLLRDLYGKPALVLSVDVPRTAHEQAQESLLYLLSALSGVGLIFGLANRAVLNGFILSRLDRLSAEIQRIGLGGDLGARLATSGRDELARLAERINGMLAALESSQRERLESEQRYRAVIQETADGIYLLDMETKRILEANAAFQDLVGYTAEELAGLTFYDLAAYDRASVDENMQRLLAEKRLSQGERKYLRKGGSLVDFEDSANLISSGGKEVACVVVRDVTRRKWMEDALRRNEAYFRALIDNSLDVIGLLNADGTVCYISPTIERMLGFKPERLTGRNAFDMIHPDDAATVRSAFAAGIQNADFTASVEFRLQHRDGSWVNVETAARSLLDNPAVMGIVFSMRDITARKRMEEALKTQALVLDSMAEGVNVADEDGIIFLTNPAFDAMFGYARGELIGKHVSILNSYTPEENDRIVGEIIARLKTQGAWFGEINNRKKDGTPFMTAARVSALEIAGKKYWISLQEDITERKRTDQALQESEERYRRLVEVSPDAIAIHAAGRIVFANPAAARLMGAATPEELIGRQLHDFVHPDYWGLVKERVRQQREEGKALSLLEEKFIRLDGAIVDVEVAASPFTFQGKPATQVIVHDTTALKRREAELQRRADEFAALLETSRDLAAPQDLPTVLNTIVERAAKLLSAACGGIYLYDPLRGDLVTSIATDPAIPLGVRLQIGEGLAGRVAQTRQPLIVDDYQSWEGRSPKFEGIPMRAIVEVPMLHRGELIGVLLVEEIGDTIPSPGTVARKFTEEDVRLLSLFAAQAASAVYNARLLEGTQRHLEELRVLHQASQALNADLSLDKVLNVVADHFIAALDVQSCTISGFDLARDDLVILLDRDPEPAAQVAAGSHFKPSEYPWYDVVLNAGRSSVFRRDDPNLEQAIRRELETYLWRSVLVVPLVSKGQLMGLVELGERRRERDFGADEIRLAESLASQAAVAIENARLYERLQAELTERERTEQEIQRRANEFGALYETAQELATQQDLPTLLETTVERAMRLLGAPCGFIYLYDAAQGDLELTVEKGMAVSPGLRLRPGEGMAGRVAQTLQPLIVDDYYTWEHRSPQYLGVPYAAVVEVPMLYGGQLIGVLGVSEVGSAERKFGEADARLLSLFAGQAASAVHNANLLQQTRARAEQLALLYDAGLALNSVLEPRAQLEFLFKIATRTLHADCSEFFGYDPAREELRFELGVGHPEGVQAAARELVFALGAERGVVGQVAQERIPCYLPDVFADPRWVNVNPNIHSALWVPVEHEDQLLGVMSVLSNRTHAFSPQDERLLVLFANQAAVALENARLFAKTERRLQRLHALGDIDKAISSSLDLRLTLEVVLDQVATQLRVDAADILLHNPRTQTLTYGSGRGFHSRALQHTELRLGEGLAGLAALERRVVHFPNLTLEADGLRRSPLLAQEHFVAYFAIPLIAKGEVKGVLEIFHRAAMETDQEWLDFAQALGAQAAIAIDDAELFQDLQRTNVELTLAYDATIEGWSRALELRDQDTEGHTTRVMDLTLWLARQLGMTEEELLHVRRGTLLHDIGNMAIPDSILFKPGKLSAAEREIMQRHPTYAHEMLSPIAYLRPALDIPYCHHEKWDGTGYPRGLKGEQIPLAARIFAVVDVWDALLSGRRYRAERSAAQAREYIQEQAGKHFDPKVVEEFLKVTGDSLGSEIKS